MIVVGAAGLLITVLALWVAYPDPQARRAKLFASLACVHVIASVVYWRLIGEWGGDANVYYLDAHGIRDQALSTGTSFVVHFLHSIKDVAGGTKLDFYLLFQSFGVIGLALLLRSIQEIGEDLGQRVPAVAYAALFIPGLHFWTSSIGKDAPVFMGICIGLWAALRIQRRYLAMAAAIAIVGAIRPHIAGLIALSLVASFLIDRNMRVAMKLALGAAALLGTVALATIIQDQFGLENLDQDSVGEFIDSRVQIGSKFEGGTNLLSLPYPLRVASLLFRPFFIDAEGVMGLAASLENLALIAIFGYLICHIGGLARLTGSVFYVRFSLVFGALTVGMLALVTFNIGLGLRQKYMAIPAFLLLFATILIYRQAVRSSRNTAPTPDSLPHPHAPPAE